MGSLQCSLACTSLDLELGLASAVDTFLQQAYGAKQYHMLGIHMQRAMLVLMLTRIPIAFPLNFTEQIFIQHGQDLEISTQAGVYSSLEYWAYKFFSPHVWSIAKSKASNIDDGNQHKNFE